MRLTNALIIINILSLSAALMPSCASGGPAQAARTYKQSQAVTIPAGTAIRSKEEIDGSESYMVYFKLGKAVDSIRIGMNSEYVADILGTKKTLELYFIVEKAIPAEHFKNIKTRYLFTEIGKNFDITDWTRGKEITIVSEKGSPLKALEDGPAYRIRFTAFSTESLDFMINIEADCEVTFMNNIE
jgi:hypothetical protein